MINSTATRQLLYTTGHPISRSAADEAARADGYELRGTRGAVALVHGRVIGTYSTHTGALRALVAHAEGRVVPGRRPHRPVARHD